jgi:hypothetical protein
MFNYTLSRFIWRIEIRRWRLCHFGTPKYKSGCENFFWEVSWSEVVNWDHRLFEERLPCITRWTDFTLKLVEFPPRSGVTAALYRLQLLLLSNPSQTVWRVEGFVISLHTNLPEAGNLNETETLRINIAQCCCGLIYARTRTRDRRDLNICV